MSTISSESGQPESICSQQLASLFCFLKVRQIRGWIQGTLPKTPFRFCGRVSADDLISHTSSHLRLMGWWLICITTAVRYCEFLEQLWKFQRKLKIVDGIWCCFLWFWKLWSICYIFGASQVGRKRINGIFKSRDAGEKTCAESWQVSSVD